MQRFMRIITQHKKNERFAVIPVISQGYPLVIFTHLINTEKIYKPPCKVTMA